MIIIPRQNLNLNITKHMGNIICNFCSLKQMTKLIIKGVVVLYPVVLPAFTKTYVNKNVC